MTETERAETAIRVFELLTVKTRSPKENELYTIVLDLLKEELLVEPL